MNSLAAEFFAGAGQRAESLTRTVFAVGDEKQSIFGFQGAAPAEFGRQRADYGRTLRERGHPFEDVRLDLSFRSTRDVISAVDRVFAQPAAFEGLGSDPVETGTSHTTARGDDSGAVDLWELLEGEPETDQPVWERPVDALSPGAPANRLAGMIAEMLKRWTDDGHDDLGAPFDPDDALILLPKRNAAFEAVVRALKLAGVPVAGMDRIVLADHAAIEDLIAAGRAALLPQDDLTLAEALVSPLIGLDDRDLLDLCPGRTGSLMQALAASPNERHVRAAERLAEWRRHAAACGPFGFYSRLLVGGGRRKLAERLGAEASDAIDAFLARALDHQRREGASLAAFLDAVSVTKDDIRRDLAEPRGEVRVMTVHGAKGLEAPIVILADIGMEPRDGRGLLGLPVPRATPRASPRSGRRARTATTPRCGRPAGGARRRPCGSITGCSTSR